MGAWTSLHPPVVFWDLSCDFYRRHSGHGRVLRVCSLRRAGRPDDPDVARIRDLNQGAIYLVSGSVYLYTLDE